MTVYDVSLSDAFVNKLRQNRSGEASTLPTPRDPASLTLRFSVPPDTLESNKSELELRRTTRGEFTLQQANSADNARDKGQAKGQGSAGPPGPTFKGPATEASDVECVLIYNHQSKQYDLHPVGLDLQMTPALKPRTKPSSSTGAKSVLREPPATSKSPMNRLSSARSSISATGNPGSSSGLGLSSTSGPTSGPGQAPDSTTSTSGASSKVATLSSHTASPGPNQTHHSAAMLAPRRATTARLPTRRTIKKQVKPAGVQTTPGASRSASMEPDQDSQSQRWQHISSNPSSAPPSVSPSAQATPKASPQTRHTRSPDPKSANGSSTPASRMSTSETSSAASSPRLAHKEQTGELAPSTNSMAQSEHNPSTASSSTLAEKDGDDARFDDDDLDDLADELADELGEDDENPTSVSRSAAVGIGTALNSVDDGEDTSEEE